MIADILVKTSIAPASDCAAYTHSWMSNGFIGYFNIILGIKGLWDYTGFRDLLSIEFCAGVLLPQTPKS
jgi:hypothetical protein